MIVYVCRIGILGMIFGSLWSVLLERLQNKYNRTIIKSILIGRSQCPKCKHTLGASELIPLVSYLIQRGKCKHCKAPISSRYPILEITSAVLFIATFLIVHIWNNYNISYLIFRLITNWLLMLLIIHDIKVYELHMPIRALLMTRIRWWQLSSWWGYIQWALLWSIVTTLFFLVIYLFGKRYVKQRFNSQEEGFGQWDIFIWASLGSLFAYIWQNNNIPTTLVGASQIALIMIILASIIWLLYFVIELAVHTGKTHRQSKDIFTEWRNTNKIIPFIPALILAFWILLYKANIILHFVF